MTMTSSGIDTTYNGWANYETWNVALYINNDYGLYTLAQEIAEAGGTYGDFCYMMEDLGSKATPDGVSWTDSKIDGMEVNEVFSELAEEG